MMKIKKRVRAIWRDYDSQPNGYEAAFLYDDAKKDIAHKIIFKKWSLFFRKYGYKRKDICLFIQEHFDFCSRIYRVHFNAKWIMKEDEYEEITIADISIPENLKAMARQKYSTSQILTIMRITN